VVFNTSNTPSREGAERIWRSSADDMGKLHLWPVRRHLLLPQDLWRGSDQHSRAAHCVAG
jgi:hypothetical protein